MQYDISFIRSQFPAFEQDELKGWAFFENAGGSYTCKQVIDRLTEFYTKTKVQPYYPYPASLKAGEWMDESYRRLAAFLNVPDHDVHLGPSTTQNIYVLAHALRPIWEDGDEIIVSCQDHEANAGAWRNLEHRGIVVKEWHIDPETGLLNPEDLYEMITPKTRLVAFPHCSNVVGHINPVKEIVDKLNSYPIITVVDGVSYAPHGFPDIGELGVDIYLFSLYKTWGPHLGLMTVSDRLVRRMENQSHFFKEGNARAMITPAGPDHAQIAAAAGVIDYFDTVYDYHFSDVVEPVVKNHFLHSLFKDYETHLLEPLLSFLKERDDVRIIGPDDPDVRAPTVSIVPNRKGVMDVVQKLTDKKCMVGYGDFYAARPLNELNIPREPGVLRMSFVHYTSMEEIQQLIKALEFALD